MKTIWNDRASVKNCFQENYQLERVFALAQKQQLVRAPPLGRWPSAVLCAPW